MGRGHIPGQMRECIQDNGLTIKCMVEVCLLGQMAGNMTEITMTIRNQDMVCLHGQMEDCMIGIG